MSSTGKMAQSQSESRGADNSFQSHAEPSSEKGDNGAILRKRSASTESDEAAYKKPKLPPFAKLVTEQGNTSILNNCPGSELSPRDREVTRYSAAAGPSRAPSPRFRSDGRRFVVRNSLSEQELLNQRNELQQRMRNEPHLRSEWQQASNRLASFKCRQKRKKVMESLQDQILRMSEIREQKLQEIEALQSALSRENEEKRVLTQLLQQEAARTQQKSKSTAIDAQPSHGQQQQVATTQAQGQRFWVSEFFKHFLLPLVSTNEPTLPLREQGTAFGQELKNGAGQINQQQTTMLEVLHGLVQTALPPVYPDSVIHHDEEIIPIALVGPPIPSEIEFLQTDNPFGEYKKSSKRKKKKKKKKKARRDEH